MATNIQVSCGDKNVDLGQLGDSEIVTVFKFQPNGRLGLMEAVSALTCRQSKNGNITALTNIEPLTKRDIKRPEPRNIEGQKQNPDRKSRRQILSKSTAEEIGENDAVDDSCVSDETEAMDATCPDLNGCESHKESFTGAMHLSMKVKSEADTPTTRDFRHRKKRTLKEERTMGVEKKKPRQDQTKNKRMKPKKELTTEKADSESMERNTEEESEISDDGDNAVEHDKNSQEKETCFKKKAQSRTVIRKQNLFCIASTIKRHQCPHCSEKFERFLQLEQHRKIHTGELQYACDICLLGFKTKNGFSDHMTVHTGNKPYNCEICGKSFRQQTGLQQHIQTHSDVKKYKCSDCDATFRTNTHLKVHMRTHTGEKPYACQYCPDKFYRDLSSMRRHNLRHHGHPHSQYKVVKS